MALIFCLGVLAMLFTLLTGASARAEPQAAGELAITPADSSAGWLELSLAPGESLDTHVVLRNGADHPVTARTYVADATSLVGGGLGSLGHGEPTTGPTSWLAYRDRTLALDANEEQVEPVTVTVPAGTPPGDYITTLAIESLPGSSSEATGLQLSQVTRSVIAVAISVPGPDEPALDVGPARHHRLGDRSVISIQVSNPGNRHLRATGQVTLRDVDGPVRHQGDVQLATIYTGTDTELQVVLPNEFPAGSYRVDTQLRNRHYDLTAAGQTEVEIFDEPAAAGPSRPIPGADLVDQVAERTGLPSWAVLAIVAAVLFGVALQIGVTLRRARHRSRSARGAGAEEVSAGPAAGTISPDLNSEDRRRDVLVPDAHPLAEPAAMREYDAPREPIGPALTLTAQQGMEELAALNELHDDAAPTRATRGSEPPSRGPTTTSPAPSTATIDPSNFTARPTRRRRRR